MACIVVTTFGSTGDLNPFIALGLALRSNGHDVLFAVEANFQMRKNFRYRDSPHYSSHSLDTA